VARKLIVSILTLIACAEAMRRVNAAIESGSQGPPEEPVRSKMPKGECEIQNILLAMDPYVFESHVMSFFKAGGMHACVTKKSNDKGFDGFAQHPKGLILVQCKRNAPSNPVGRPVIQQFKGVIEENDAWRGYFVTTSRFTQDAHESAEVSQKLMLVEMNDLVQWHQNVPKF
jgi:restriction system protein